MCFAWEEANKQIDAEIMLFDQLINHPSCFLPPPYFHTLLHHGLSSFHLGQGCFCQGGRFVTAAAFFQLQVGACWGALFSSPTCSLQPHRSCSALVQSYDCTTGSCEGDTGIHMCTYAHRMQLHTYAWSVVLYKGYWFSSYVTVLTVDVIPTDAE